jgi:MFS family permease
MAKVCSPLLIRCGLEFDSARYFKSPTGALLGIYAASLFIPSIFTAFIGDFVSTKMGRRWCIIIANIIITIGCLVNTFASSIGMWCGGIFFPTPRGIGLPVDQCLQAVLLLELVLVL